MGAEDARAFVTSGDADMLKSIAEHCVTQLGLHFGIDTTYFGMEKPEYTKKIMYCLGRLNIKANATTGMTETSKQVWKAYKTRSKEIHPSSSNFAQMVKKSKNPENSPTPIYRR